MEERIPTSQRIRGELIRDKVPYCIDDNISSYVSGNDLDYLEDELTEKFYEVLKVMLIDMSDPNTRDTPRRLAKMFLNELFSGRYKPKPKVTSFPNHYSINNNNTYNGMIVIKAELKSVCAHHFQPITGMAYIGILPSYNVLGLSKYIRLAQHCARRGTLQEKLCTQIANEVSEAAKTYDVAVHLAMDHGCCTNRGVNAHSALTQTTVLKGRFLDEPGVKEEFFDNVKMQVMK